MTAPVVRGEGGGRGGGVRGAGGKSSTIERVVLPLSGCRGVHKDYHGYDRGRTKQTYLDAGVTDFARYKFAVAGENTLIDGYLTEKIVTVLLAKAIPIYIGSPNVKEFVNPARFVHCDVPRADVLALRGHDFPKGDHTTRDKQESERLAWIRSNQPGTMAALRRCAEEVRKFWIFSLVFCVVYFDFDV